MRWRVVFLLALLPAPALAAGRGEASLSAGPELLLLHPSATRAGPGLDARFRYGVSDAWSAHAGFAAAWLPSSGASPTTVVTTATVGTTVSADVLNWVPFAEAGIAFADERAAGMSRQRLGGALGAGVDYYLSRRLTLSLRGDGAYFPLRLGGSADSTPVAITLGSSLGYVF